MTGDAIPVYAHAAVHLAGSDPAEKAIARLEPLTKTSDDPDVLAALADAHQRAKHDVEAKKYGEQARARYDELVKRHDGGGARPVARRGDGGECEGRDVRSRDEDERAHVRVAGAQAARGGDAHGLRGEVAAARS